MIASQTPIDVYSGDENKRCASETCMKDAEIMRQNARFRSSWSLQGGDLITLTVRVAGATVVKRRHRTLPAFGKINKLGWPYN